jgi:hypothetical protein
MTDEPFVTAPSIMASMLAGKFHRATDAEIRGFADLFEGDVWVWEPDGDEDEIVCIDHQEGRIVVQVRNAFTGQVWSLDPSTSEWY